MGNCYIFNPAEMLLHVTLNGVFLGTIPAADAAKEYRPLSKVIRVVARDDGVSGAFGLHQINRLALDYPADPNEGGTPYEFEITVSGSQVSIDDDVIVHAMRHHVSVLSKRGFVLGQALSQPRRS
jgi:hypothetical protein